MRARPRFWLRSLSPAAAAGSRRSIRKGRRRASSPGCSGSSPPCSAAIWLRGDDRARRRRCCGAASRAPIRSLVDPAERAPHDVPSSPAVGRDRASTVLVADGAQLRLANERSFAHRGGGADDPRHRAPMVVGGRATRTPHPSRSFTTANELHIPVGEPVKLKLESADVIHSFWVPSLTGKQDLIPGQRERHPASRRPAGHLPRPVRRVLRAAARPYGHPRRRRGRGGFRALARSRRSGRGRPPADRRAARRAGDLLSAGPASCATQVRGTRPAARSRPTSPMSAAAAPRRRHAADEPRQPRRLDRRPARHQARRQHAGRSSSIRDEINLSLAYLEGLK